MVKQQGDLSGRKKKRKVFKKKPNQVEINKTAETKGLTKATLRKRQNHVDSYDLMAKENGLQTLGQLCKKLKRMKSLDEPREDLDDSNESNEDSEMKSFDESRQEVDETKFSVESRQEVDESNLGADELESFIESRRQRLNDTKSSNKSSENEHSPKTLLEDGLCSFFDCYTVGSNDELPSKNYADTMKSHLRMWVKDKTFGRIDITDQFKFAKFHVSYFCTFL